MEAKMNVKQIRKLLEKLDDALDDVEFEVDTATEERDDYAFQLEEKTEEIEHMEAELRLLCQLLFDAKVEIPREDHYIDINPYVPKADPFRGEYAAC